LFFTSIFQSQLFKKCISENQAETGFWRYQNNTIRDIYDNLLVNPAYKLLQIKNAPQTSEHSKEFSNDTWEGLLGRLYDMLLYDSTEMTISKKKTAKPLSCYGGIIYMRGKNSFEFSPMKFPCFSIADGLDLKFMRDKHQTHGLQKSIGALWNSPFLMQKLKKMLGKVYTMYKLKAYSHHYAKYGIGNTDFQNSFIELENVIKNYEQI